MSNRGPKALVRNTDSNADIEIVSRVSIELPAASPLKVSDINSRLQESRSGPRLTSIVEQHIYGLTADRFLEFTNRGFGRNVQH